MLFIIQFLQKCNQLYEEEINELVKETVSEIFLRNSWIYFHKNQHCLKVYSFGHFLTIPLPDTVTTFYY